MRRLFQSAYAIAAMAIFSVPKLADTIRSQVFGTWACGDSGLGEALVLDIITLDEAWFVTRNTERRKRARIRCIDIEITRGDNHAGH